MFAGLSGLLYFSGETAQSASPAPSAPVLSPPASGPVADPFYRPAPGTPATTQTAEPLVTPQPPVSAPPEPRPPRPDPAIVATPPAAPPRDARVLPAQERSGGAEITFIVRIKGSDSADKISDTFVKSPDEAKRAWSSLLTERPGLAGFRLVETTGSDELILGYTLPGGQKPSFDEVARIQKKLLAIDGVAYADPDSIAHPGKE